MCFSSKNYKYLFITYGEPGWRGVQIRSLRMAKYLPKDKVLFWNSDDSEIIKKSGFDVQTIKSGLINPQSIKFPQGVEVVIFSDLPSNKLYNYSIFMAALQQNLRIVICEQLYKRGQMKEGVYKKFANNCDIFLLNSLSFFYSEQTDKIKIVPPQIEFQFDTETKKEICNRYQIPENDLIIFGVGYHEKIFEKIKKITRKLEKTNNNFTTVVSSPQVQTQQRIGRLNIIPFEIGDDYFRLLYSADLVLVKFGFLQILEALSLQKPTIVLGEGGLVLRDPKLLDEKLRENLRFDLEITEETIRYIRRFLSDQNFRNDLKNKISKLHNGELFGAKKAVEEIKKMLSTQKTKRIPPKKKIAVLVNNEILKKEAWLKNQEEIYPLCFVIPAESEKFDKERVPPDLLEKKIRNFVVDREDEILSHSFKDLFIFSDRKYDGFIDILYWYDAFLNNLETLFKNADEIYLSPFGLKLFEPLIRNLSAKNKIKIYP